MSLNRNFVTPLITIFFLVVAFSGVLMFFHIFDGYTEVVHEIFGLFFVVFSVFHIILHWKALKIHFKKQLFISTSIVVAAISGLFIIQQHNNPKFDTILLEKITNAPIGDVFRVLKVDSTEAVKRLDANGISFEGAATIEEIRINNKKQPKRIFDLIME
jgi:uncharacterized membrane protein